ncbi:redoxin domain-containing protein, partial [Candidatus Woesearchaeota archaeon]|nr:redoxin domain-containing protein [Candidatus Woesearchaeota archaeon]
MGIEEVKISLRRQNLSEDDFQRISEKSKKYPLAPELAGIAGYLNTDGEEIRIADYRGKKAVLIDFWTYTCINCIRTLPHLAEWDKKYRDKGLAIIGVHTPEFNFEKEKKNVEMAIKKYGIPYPVVQDNDYATWSAYQNRYWPRKYLVDADGFIRYDHIGEGGYDDTEEMIQKLLMELGPEIAGKDGGIGSI